MIANTVFNDLAGCLLSLHKLQVDPLGRLGEAGDLWHNTRTSLRLILNLTPRCDLGGF
jgi:hypothetical protein